LPYKVTVAIYNSAGELVRTVFDGDMAGQPVSVQSAYLPPTANGTLPLLLQLGGSGNSGLIWDATNDNGQAVAGGTYYVKVQTIDPYGTVTAFTQGVAVLPPVAADSIDIFNSAGELVRVLPVPAAGGAATDMNVKGPAVAVGGNGSGVAFQVAQVGGGGVVIWDGLNDQGQPVQSGSYMARLIHSVAGQATTVKIIGITLLTLPGSSSQAALAAAVAGPQPWTPAAAPSGRLMVAYPPLPGRQVWAGLYDLAGELVLSALDADGSGLLSLPMGRVSAGVYLLRLKACAGAATLAARTMKVAVIR
jgi:flagellar hook assembly protein FlgD